MLRTTLPAACVAATFLFGTPASADEGVETNFAGTATGQYLYLDVGGQGVSIKGIAGEGKFGLGAGIHVQAQASYNYATLPGTHLTNWSIGGAPYWESEMGRLGAVANYYKAQFLGLSGHTTTFGGFGEYFANPYFTFGLKGGGYAGDVSGSYAGAQVTGYVFPDFAVTGAFSYIRVNRLASQTNLSLQGEYLLSEDLPIAVFAGYVYGDVSNGGGTTHKGLIGVRLYLNSDGYSTLVDRQRHGTVGTIGHFGPVGENY